MTFYNADILYIYYKSSNVFIYFYILLIIKHSILYKTISYTRFLKVALKSSKHYTKYFYTIIHVKITYIILIILQGSVLARKKSHINKNVQISIPFFSRFYLAKKKINTQSIIDNIKIH